MAQGPLFQTMIAINIIIVNCIAISQYTPNQLSLTFPNNDSYKHYYSKLYCYLVNIHYHGIDNLAQGPLFQRIIAINIIVVNCIAT